MPERLAPDSGVQHGPVGAVLTIFLNERWITCCMCGEEADHTLPEWRRCVPIWNGDPTSSKATQVDGYLPVCMICYGSWDRWDNGLSAKATAAAVEEA